MVSAFIGAPVLIWLGAPSAARRCNMIAPSRRLLLSCLILLATSLLVSLWGLGSGLVPLSVEQVLSRSAGRCAA
ncbi:iron-enterobactin transporter permease [Raoultella planticola]|uniref:Iron-enterobactin transporter permease n=1 Tax=Raoultella planticola TaxID=575 RepID=A0A485CP80_RAOPL|nr:iron-enterobactin transporter permease [Raoultella planticola]